MGKQDGYHIEDGQGNYQTSNSRDDGPGTYVSRGNHNLKVHSTYLYKGNGDFEKVRRTGYSRVSKISSAVAGLADNDKQSGNK